MPPPPIEYTPLGTKRGTKSRKEGKSKQATARAKPQPKPKKRKRKDESDEEAQESSSDEEGGRGNGNAANERVGTRRSARTQGSLGVAPGTYQEFDEDEDEYKEEESPENQRRKEGEARTLDGTEDRDTVMNGK